MLYGTERYVEYSCPKEGYTGLQEIAMEIVKNPNFQKMLNEILKLYERSKLRYSFFLLHYFNAGHHRAPPGTASSATHRFHLCANIQANSQTGKNEMKFRGFQPLIKTQTPSYIPFPRATSVQPKVSMKYFMSSDLQQRPGAPSGVATCGNPRRSQRYLNSNSK